VPDDQDVAGLSVTTARGHLPGQRTALSEELMASLHEAFDGEVADRMPRLRAVPTERPGRELVSQARRDAHSLASSAAVVGMADVSRCARALEFRFDALLVDPSEPLPESLADDIAELDALLLAGSAARQDSLASRAASSTAAPDTGAGGGDDTRTDGAS
jgi:HPt (histidine-containing phosphotransfer) domain-containing protein